MDCTFALFFVAFLAGIQTEVSSYSFDKDSKRHYIYWDSTITESIKDPSYSIHVELGHFLDIVCPHMNFGITDNPAPIVSFDIYNVTKEGYETCDHTKGGRLIFACNLPKQENKLTIKFQSISPSPFGFRFQEESEYYFIAVKPSLKKGKKSTNKGCTQESERLRINVGRSDDKNPTPIPATTTTQKPKISFVDRILKEQIEKQNKKTVIPDIMPVRKELEYEEKVMAVSSQLSGNGENGSSQSTRTNLYMAIFVSLTSMFYIINSST